MFIDNMCQRPKTTRRYLHPPCSERMFTLWAEGKIIFGEHDFDLETTNIMEERIQRRMVSCAIWPVLGKDMTPFDFHTAQNGITEDGSPIHSIAYKTENIAFSMETFCNPVRKATLFGKITLQNISDSYFQDTLSIMMRTALEPQLLCGICDGYVSHNPSIADFKAIPPSWCKRNDIYDDGTHFLSFSVPTRWSRRFGTAIIDIDLLPGEEMSFTFRLDKGEIADYDYEAEKANTIAFWQKELSRINKLPATISKDPAMMKAIRHMVTQLLQMFAVTIPENLHIIRQGAMQRAIWPTEAMSVIEGLARIGDFGDYIEPVFQTYFEAMQLPTGEIGPFGIYWGSITSAVLNSFAQYCNQAENKRFFYLYRDQILKAFRFIADLRRSVLDSEDTAGGLFPVLRGIDWTQQFQCWTSTDIFNLLGLDALADTFSAYADDAAAEIRKEHVDYLLDVKRHFKRHYVAQSGNQSLRIPLRPIGDDTELVNDFYPLLYHGRFVLSGVIDNEADIMRVYRHMLETGITQEGLGLYGHMPYPDGNDNIWYLSFPDLYWFEIWMKYGNRDKAKEIIDAQLLYAMSEEYYFTERIDANDPYYIPWSPNASAAGRTLIMLSKYYA